MTAYYIFKAKQLLTLKVANDLIGKKIATTSHEYNMNKPHISTFIIKEIITEWEMAGRLGLQEHWSKISSPDRLAEVKANKIILTEKGEFIHKVLASDKLFDEPTFVGSDSDRPIFYLEINED